MGALFYEPSCVSPPIVYRDGRVQVPTGLGFGVVPDASGD
jgi:muconate cycloisomerase